MQTQPIETGASARSAEGNGAGFASAAVSEAQIKMLTFRTGDATYGIELSHVTEIVGIQPITEVPEVPPYIKGIMNLRGRIVPVMDLRCKFGWEEAAYHDRTCIVILDVRDQVVGLIVESVSEVLPVLRQDIHPAPGFKSDVEAAWLKGIVQANGGIQLILDCERLLDLEPKA